MKRRQVLFIVLSGALGLALIGIALYFMFFVSAAPGDYGQGTVTIRGVTLNVAIADTIATRTQGLSDRPSMPQDDGMLFIFPFAAKQTFWMKDMHFALDMVWIRKGAIVDITRDIPPPPDGASLASLKTYSPSSTVDQVLEVNAGVSAKYGWQVGDTVQFTHG